MNEKPDYKCSICKDFHFLHPREADGSIDYTRTVVCRCVKESWEEDKKRNIMRYCELPPRAKYMTFENFKNPRNNPDIADAYAACLAAAEGTSEDLWITMASGPGRGKTHLAVAVCNYRLSQGKLAKYTYVPLLMKELKDGFSETGDGSYKNRYDTFLNVPLLVMDDLGTENPTRFVQEHLDTIFDYRLMHNLPMVITTNCQGKELPFRILSRLKRGGKIITIDAPEFKYKRLKDESEN